MMIYLKTVFNYSSEQGREAQTKWAHEDLFGRNHNVILEKIGGIL